MSSGIEFECPHCARVTRVPRELAGRQGRCPGCRKVLEIPEPAPEAEAGRSARSSPVSAREERISGRAPEAVGPASARSPRTSGREGRSDPPAASARNPGALGGVGSAGDDGEPLAPLVIAALCGVLLCPPFATILGLVAAARAPGPRNRRLAFLAIGLSVVGYLIHLGGHMLLQQARTGGR